MEILQPIFECPVCLERLKDPKVLGCFHSMCNLCVQQFVATNAYNNEMPCPTCRQVTPIPAPGGAAGAAKLPVNSYLASLIDVASKVLATSVADSPSTSMGGTAHPARDVDANEQAKCRRHSSEAVQLYCASCASPICVQCVLTSCRQHEHKSMASAAGEARGTLTRLASKAGSFMGNAARAGTDARAYRVEMLEQKAAFLHTLEQRRIVLDAAVRSAYDEAVKLVERRATSWDSAATDFSQRVSESQSQCQRLLIELGDLISHRSDLTVVSEFPDAEKRLNELLTSVRLQEAALARQKFALLSGSNDHVAAIKKLFKISVAEDKETTLRLLGRPEEPSKAVNRKGSTAANAIGTVRKDSVGDEAAAPVVDNASSEALYATASQPIVYPGLSNVAYQPLQAAAAAPVAVMTPIVYPGLSKQTSQAFTYGAGLTSVPQAPLMPHAATRMPMAYPTVPLLPYPSSLAPGIGVRPPSVLPQAGAPANIATTLSSRTASPLTATMTSAPKPAAPAADTGTKARSKGQASPLPVDLGSLKQTSAAKISKKTVKKWVQRTLAAIGQAEAIAPGTGSAVTTTAATPAEIGAEVVKYLREAQCDSDVLATVAGLLLTQSCEKTDAARALACVAKQLVEGLSSVALSGEAGKTTNFKKVLHDCLKLELDLKGVGSTTSQRVVAGVQFVACLFDEEVVNEWMMHDGIIRCLKEEGMEDCLEYGCGLLSHYLHRLDTPNAVPRINQHLKQITRLKTLPGLSSHIKAALQDVLTQRESKKNKK